MSLMSLCLSFRSLIFQEPIFPFKMGFRSCRFVCELGSGCTNSAGVFQRPVFKSWADHSEPDWTKMLFRAFKFGENAPHEAGSTVVPGFVATVRGTSLVQATRGGCSLRVRYLWRRKTVRKRQTKSGEVCFWPKPSDHGFFILWARGGAYLTTGSPIHIIFFSNLA